MPAPPISSPTATRLYASQLLCEHLRLLPERDPHDRLLGLAVDALDDGLRRTIWR